MKSTLSLVVMLAIAGLLSHAGVSLATHWHVPVILLLVGVYGFLCFADGMDKAEAIWRKP